MNTEKEALEMLSKEGENIKKIQETMRKINKLVHNSPSINDVYKIKQCVDKIEKTLKQSKFKETVEQEIQQIKEKIPAWEKDAKRSFGQKLERTLQGMGFELKGQYSELKTLFYTLKVSFDNNTIVIWYGPMQEELYSIKKLDADIIAQRIKDLHIKITQRGFDDKTFLSDLYNAYKVAVHRKEEKIGDSIPIIDVLLQYAITIQNEKFRKDPIKKNYTEYGRVFFSYDLYRLKERKIDKHELNLITATRAYTRKKSDFLWIPSNENGDGTCFSHIKFREV